MSENTLTYVIFGAFALIMAVAVIIAFLRFYAIRNNGIEANAVVSRVKEKQNTDSEGFTNTSYLYFVTFTTQSGQTVEAKLGNPPFRTQVGDKLRIKYLPNKPKFVIAVK